ncbi:MAG: sensor domain-containing diguanylate cyclase [Spirochaetaceae bacterium]
MLTILDTIKDGILLIDKDLEVHAWNQWLEINTKILKKDIIGKKLSDIFPEVLEKKIARKIRVTLSLKSDVFMNSIVDKYLIKIPQNKMIKSVYENMQQDVVFSFYEPGLVSIVIYDQTLLLEAKEKITLQATTDQLTGAFNRFKFTEVLDLEISRTRRYKKPLSLILLDIDHFKNVNDTHGHLVGDTVLICLSQIIHNLIRDTDLFARWGGEEFILLLPETSLEDGLLLAERIRIKISEYNFEPVTQITCSLGLTLFNLEDNHDSFIKRADDALYRAKESGRNNSVTLEKN